VAILPLLVKNLTQDLRSACLISCKTWYFCSWATFPAIFSHFTSMCSTCRNSTSGGKIWPHIQVLCARISTELEFLPTGRAGASL